MRVSLSELAQDDANAAIDWYIGQGAYIAADDFANALEQAFGLLSGFPHVGAQAAHNTRVLTLRSFPYSVFYRIQHNEDSCRRGCPSQSSAGVLGWAAVGGFALQKPSISSGTRPPKFEST